MTNLLKIRNYISLILGKGAEKLEGCYALRYQLRIIVNAKLNKVAMQLATLYRMQYAYQVIITNGIISQ